MTTYCKCGRSTATVMHLAKCPRSGYVTAKSRIVTALTANPSASYAEIAKMTKLPRPQVILWASKCNLRRGPGNPKTPEAARRRVLQLRQRGLSYRAIGRLTNISYTTAKNICAAGSNIA